MNTFQLSCFLTVAETLNFARAAKQLNVTQPAVTHQIRSLETELGVKLFKRSTRSVELTREGSIFINDAKSMIAISLRAKSGLNPLLTTRFRSFPSAATAIPAVSPAGYLKTNGSNPPVAPPPPSGGTVPAFYTGCWKKKTWMSSWDFRNPTKKKFPVYTGN